jgi:hypothetical protein
MFAFAPSLRGRVGTAVAAGALVLTLAGPTAYSVQTAATTHSGSLPTAGPGGQGGPGGRGGRGGPGGGFGGPLGMNVGNTANGAATTGTASANAARPANVGGLLDGSTSSPAIDTLLQADAGSYTWAAAAVGSNSASGYQLSADVPVMAIGGFNGSDPSPTLAQFQQYVKGGKIHYFISGGGALGGGMGGPGGTNATTSSISTWVSSNYRSVTVDGVTFYDLTQPVTAT